MGSSEGALESREKRCGVGWEEGLACRAYAQATTGPPKPMGSPSSSSNTGQGRGCRMSPHPCSPPRLQNPLFMAGPGHPDKGHTSQPSLQLPMSK